MRGTNELHVVVVAAFAAIGHDLGNRQTLERVGQRLLQAAGQRLAFGEAAKVDVVRFPIRCNVKLVRTIARVEGRRRKMRAAERRESFAQRLEVLARDLRRHQLLDDLGIRGDASNASNRHGEPSRRCIGDNGAVLFEKIEFLKPTRERACERVAQLLQRLRRQLFDEKLDGERFDRHVALRCSAASIGYPSAARDSTYACATCRDRLRMRPMYAARSVTEIAPRASSRLNVCAALRIIS